MCPTRPYNTKLVFKGFFKYTQAMQSDVLQIHLHAYSGAIEEYLGQYISTWWGFSPFYLQIHELVCSVFGWFLQHG